MDIKEAAEKVASAVPGDRVIVLMRAARDHTGTEARELLHQAALRCGLGKHEIEAAFNAVDRG